MITIVGGLLIIALIIGLIVVEVAIHRLYAQAFIFAAGLGGLVSGIAGVVKLTDSPESDDLVGAVLLAVGIATFLVIGIAFMAFRDRAER